MVVWLGLLGVVHAQDALVLETYNVGLAHGFVDHAAGRLPLITDALSGEGGPDVLCVQEAWLTADRRGLQQALSEQYPHSHVLPVEQHRAEKAPACKRRELFGEDRFVSCMTGACDGLDGDALTDCIVDSCGPILRDLRDDNPSCAMAVMAQVGKSPLAAIWTVMRPIRRANLFAYGGSDGLMMLSRVPLQNTGVVDFTDISTLNRRRALHADVSLDGQTVRLYCTHLTAMLDNVAPYPGSFDSWGAENSAQVDRLLQHATGHEGPVAILGDVNTGPALPAANIQAEAPDSHAQFVHAGYADPVLDLQQCTYCADNALLDEGASNVVLDHIFVRGLSGQDGRRTRDDITSLVDGTAVHLSDHYGYGVTISLPVAQPEAPQPSDPALENELPVPDPEEERVE